MKYIVKKGSIFYNGKFLQEGSYVELEVDQAETLNRVHSSLEITQATSPEPEPKIVAKKKWQYNPEHLENLDLDSLNAMVYNVDKTIEPFDTVEEAAAQLSLNFEK